MPTLKQPERGIRTQYVSRYGYSAKLAKGMDDSHDSSTLADEALTLAENARIVDGVVVCRGGLERASRGVYLGTEAMNGSVVGMIETPDVPPTPPPLYGSLLSGLYCYWPFDETSGTRAKLLGIGGANLAETGGAVASAAGKFNRAVSQDGANAQYLSATIPSVSFNSGLTMAVWVNLSPAPPNHAGRLLAFSNSVGTDWIFLARYFNGNGIEFGFSSPGGVATSAAIPVLPNTGSWHVFIAWWDPVRKVAECQWDTSPVYNTDFGLPATSVDITGWTFDRVHVAGDGVNSAFHGLIDAPMVWSRMLTATERAQLGRI